MTEIKTMTLEEALSYEGYKELPPRYSNIPEDVTMEQAIIDRAIQNYNFYIYLYKREKERTLEELGKTAEKTGDSINQMVITFETEESYVKRKGSYGPKFNAWSPGHVYVRGTYDGHTWVVGVPRNPSNKLTEVIGGG